MKKRFKLEDLLPIEVGNYLVDENLAMKAEKMGLKLQQPKETIRIKSVMHQNEICMYIPQQKQVLKRYLVLTPMALVVYIDKGSFTSKPIKPFMIVPLSEIQEVDLHKAKDKRDFNIENDEKSLVSLNQSLSCY